MSINFDKIGSKASVNELRSPTVLQKKVKTDDGQGGQIETWVAQATLWAKDTTHRSMLVDQGGQMIVAEFHEVTIRYYAGLIGGTAYRFQGVFGTWYIKSVIDPGNDLRWMVCTCTAEQS